MKLYMLVILVFLCLGCTASSNKQKAFKEINEEVENYNELKNNQEFDAALTSALKIKEMAEEEFSRHEVLADAYNLLGLAYRDIGHLQKAEAYFERALDAENVSLDLSSSVYYNLALIYRTTNQQELALASIRKSLDIYREQKKEDSSDIYQKKQMYGEILAHNYQFEQAGKLLHEVLTHAQAEKDSTLIMSTVSSIVFLNTHLRNLDDALKDAETLLAYHARSGDKHAYALALSHAATAYLLKDDYEKALAYYKKSADYTMSFNKDSASISIVMNNIANLYEKKKDLAAAAYYRKIYNRLKR